MQMTSSENMPNEIVIMRHWGPLRIVYLEIKQDFLLLATCENVDRLLGTKFVDGKTTCGSITQTGKQA